jgi:hypothetical protein
LYWGNERRRERAKRQRDRDRQMGGYRCPVPTIYFCPDKDITFPRECSVPCDQDVNLAFHITARRYLPTDLYNVKYDRRVTTLTTTINNPIWQVLIILVIHM